MVAFATLFSGKDSGSPLDGLRGGLHFLHLIEFIVVLFMFGLLFDAPIYSFGTVVA